MTENTRQVKCKRCFGNRHRFYEGMSVTEAAFQIATGADGLTLRVDICDRCNGSGVEDPTARTAP